MTASANSAAALFCEPDAGSKSKKPSNGKTIPTPKAKESLVANPQAAK